MPGLQYFHRVEYQGNEDKSHYKQHVRKTGAYLRVTIERLKKMR
jgi:hypothetical protein